MSASITQYTVEEHVERRTGFAGDEKKTVTVTCTIEGRDAQDVAKRMLQAALKGTK